MFKSLFGKKNTVKSPRGFHSIQISGIEKISDDTVKVSLSIPDNLKSKFSFIPGQYLNFQITVDGKEYRRSYSICSVDTNPLQVAIKKVENGKVSTWFNEVAEVGQTVFVSEPEGNFIVPDNAQKIIAIAAGSGITPILSIALDAESKDRNIDLYFGSSKQSSILFKNTLDQLKNTTTTHYLSREKVSGFENGRIDKEAFTSIVKANLEILKSDAFLICGPEEMILDVVDTLKMFGVEEGKIKYELFTTPVHLKQEEKSQEKYDGDANVSLVLDHEEHEFVLNGGGMSILEKAIKEGIDAPYSCKGGVCSSCKAKVIEGSASMEMNFSLTDRDIEAGYILTCQAHPTSETLKISYDD